ncbi:hypothetical protein DL546_000336 [Coniochaeta pulveracea]|uniref:Uncharacterized protein n=1 Tax=Coniochaeta pulveracea TaxID=177199 RepID=A0A420XVQ0_9PEZI|nr:hypothetical protein DL546_000336 [Coniochaeta pulveracea]
MSLPEGNTTPEKQLITKPSTYPYPRTQPSTPSPKINDRHHRPYTLDMGPIPTSTKAFVVGIRRKPNSQRAHSSGSLPPETADTQIPCGKSVPHMSDGGLK